MSGIAGVVTDGQDDLRPALHRLAQGLGPRASAGAMAHWAGQAGFVRGLDSAEVQTSASLAPLATEGLLIVADLRLDNLLELRAALGQSSDAPPLMVIAAAYRRWGEGFAGHLLGDFSVAIWDSERRALICCRDHFGVRGLCYTRTPDGLAFASDPRPLLSMGLASPDLNRRAVADYISGFVTTQTDTFFETIVRAPPGHVLVWSGREVRLWPYFVLRVPEADHPGRAEERVLAFQETFEQAVAARVTPDRTVGAFLSGGMDSSSIAVVARRLENGRGRALPTVSRVFDRYPAQNESSYQQAVIRQGGCLPLVERGDEVRLLDNLPSILWEQSGPFLGLGTGLSRSLYGVAQNSGLTVLLDGHGGDEVVSMGTGRLFELARQGRWLRTFNELRQMPNAPTLDALLGLFIRFGPVGRHGWRLQALRRKVRALRTRDMSDAFEPDFAMRLVDPGLARETDQSGREADRVRQATTGDDDRSLQYDNLTIPLQSYALEGLERMSSSFGIQSRFPMWDKRLVELSLSLPGEDKLKHGHDRWILRKAMQGLLPDLVRLRRTKCDFGPVVADQLFIGARDVLDEIVQDRDSRLAGYVDLGVLRQTYDRAITGDAVPSGYVMHGLYRTLSLGLWLRDPTGAGFAASLPPVHVIMSTGAA